MANSSTKSLPVRAISLPSREHPISLKFDAILNHLNIWQTSTSETTPFGAESIRIGLVGVAELYNCVDEIILTPQARQAILHNQSGKLVNEALDASVTLLDTCSTVKDILQMMKENVLALQSAFRRSRGRNSSFERNVHGYIKFRKNVQRGILKSLQTLKKLDVKFCFSIDDDQDLSMVARVIRGATAITISIFRLLFLFLSLPEKKRFGGWSLVSKLMVRKSFSCEDCQAKKITNELKSLDFSIFNLEEHLKGEEDLKEEVKNIQSLLETVNLSVDRLDSELESMSKCLVQNRVSLLNILTQQ